MKFTMYNVDETENMWADGPYDTEDDAMAAAIAHAESVGYPTERVFAECREDGLWDAVVWFAYPGSPDAIPPGCSPEPAPAAAGPDFPWWILIAAGSLFFL